MQELIRLFLVEAGDAPEASSSTSAAVQLRPAALEDEAEDEGAAEAMQQYAQRRAREIAAQAGACEAATVWTCVCGCAAVNWAPCPGCGADMPQRAMQAAIAGVRAVLDAAPDGSGAATHAFRRGVLDGYAVGRSGLLKKQPAAFRLCDAALMPAPPLPSAAVRLLRI